MLRKQKHFWKKYRSILSRTKQSQLAKSLSRKPRLEMLEMRALMAANPLTSIPVLNSNPSATAAIYLDFNGHFDATWAATTPVFDSDGDRSTFSDNELAYITDVWKIVAEDYAPFNINVTTVEPAVLAPGVPGSAANGVALRVAIGGSASVIGQSSAVVGYAIFNSFTNSANNLAFVFPESAPAFISSVATTGTSASHNAGFSFGLRRQSGVYNIANKTQGIMNSANFGYDDATWSLTADTLGSLQDDMAMLSNSLNGFGYRADDVGGTIATAAPLNGANGVFTASGIIGNTSDVDVFALSSSAARGLRIDVGGSVIGQNLDIVIDYLDAAGNVILTANPSDSLDAVMNVPANGMQYIAIRSTGIYGRVGQYTISVTEATPGVEVVARPSGIKTSEQMVNDSFTLRLTSRPTADVTIGVASSDLTEGIVSASQIVFTPQNWYLPQTVVVSGVDDGEVDGVVLYNILLGGVSSADSHYAGMSIASLQASNADNDIPGSAFQIAVSNTFITSAIRNDSLGNTYITGYFLGTVDFDPGVGITQLTSPARFFQGFIVKYSPAHELIWARQFGGSDGHTSSEGLDVDSNGNAFVTGDTSSKSAIFGSSTLPGDGTNDAFLARLDSNGNFEWVRGWGGTSFVLGKSVHVGADGIIHVGGSLYGTADLDPSANTFSRTSAGGSDGYISRFTSNGAFISAVSIGGTLDDLILRTVVDAAGNTYATGSFNGTAQFGNHVLNSAGAEDYFLLKMNAGGSIEWVRQVAGAANGGAGSRLSLDSAGSVILAGDFTESINFGPGTPTLVSGGNQDSFITKWDATGTLLQVGQLSGLERVRVTGLTVGTDDVMTIVGWFAGTADLDPGSNELLVTSLDAQNGFILRMHSGGNVMTVLQTSGRGVIRDVTQDAKGNISAIGTFSSTVSLPTGQVFVNADASGDLYVLKLNIAAGATVSPSVGLVTSEDGTSTSFNVVLDIPPTADVTIPISSSNPGEGVVSRSSLTFTPANWNVPQTVVVTGVNDAVIDGDKSYSIVLGPATSADPAYNGFKANDLRVTNTDNDLAPTKFYVVDDASSNRTFEYGANGSAVENYSLSSGNATPRGAASTVAGDKVWVVDANRNVYIYNDRGVLLGSWSAGSLASNATIEGITTNGTDIWLVDARQDRVFRYAGAASRLSGSQNAASNFALNSGNRSPKDLVTDGTNIWVVNDSTTDKVFKYSMTGALVGSWTIATVNNAPTGITIDPSGATQSIWIVDNGTDRVYEYTNSRSRNSGSQSTLISFALAVGNTNPQGIADPPANSINASTAVAATSSAAIEASSVQMLSASEYPQGQVAFTSRSIAVGSVSNDNALTTSKLLYSQPATLILENGSMMTTFVSPTPRLSTSKSSSIAARDEAFSSVNLLQDEDMLDLLTTSVKGSLKRRRI